VVTCEDTKGDEWMKSLENEVDLYTELVENFRFLPLPLTKAVIKLKKEQLWREIGKALTNVPLDEKVNYARLRNRISKYTDQNGVRYLDLKRNLEELEKIKYIHVDRKSEPAYYPTSILVQGLEFIDNLEKVTKEAIVRSLKRDPRFKGYGDLDNLVESGIYTALEDSLKR